MYYHESRITENTDVAIKSAIFCGFSADTGAAVFIKAKVAVTLEECTVESCTASYGGFLYLENGLSFTFTKSSARYCTAHYGDRHYGNVAYMINTQVNLVNLSSCFLCSPAKKAAGDSTFTLNGLSADCHFSNFSCCASQVGASALNNLNGAVVSVTYVNVHNSDSCCSYVMESGGPGTFTVKWSNHIGNIMEKEFWNNANTNMVVSDSVVMSQTPSSCLMTSGVTFINCYSNYTDIQLFTYTSDAPVTRNIAEERGNYRVELIIETGKSRSCREYLGILLSLIE